MKTLIQVINEKLKLSNVKHYNYFPENSDELKKIIEDHFKNNNVDLTDIDVSKVTEFNSLFARLRHQNYKHINKIDVTSWDTSQVTHMARMFFNNSYLENIIGIEDWDVSNVKSMRSMFYNCDKLNIDLSKWNINSECNVENIVKGSENIKLPKL